MCNNTNKFALYHQAKWKKPLTKNHIIVQSHSYEIARTDKSAENVGEEETGSDC